MLSTPADIRHDILRMMFGITGKDHKMCKKKTIDTPSPVSTTTGVRDDFFFMNQLQSVIRSVTLNIIEKQKVTENQRKGLRTCEKNIY